MTHDETLRAMIELVSSSDNIDDIMYNAYDRMTEKLKDEDIHQLADIYFGVTGRLDKANKLYTELSHFNEGLM